MSAIAEGAVGSTAGAPVILRGTEKHVLVELQAVVTNPHLGRSRTRRGLPGPAWCPSPAADCGRMTPLRSPSEDGTLKAQCIGSALPAFGATPLPMSSSQCDMRAARVRPVSHGAGDRTLERPVQQRVSVLPTHRCGRQAWYAAPRAAKCSASAIALCERGGDTRQDRCATTHAARREGRVADHGRAQRNHQAERDPKGQP
jgi:hypothetical protein